MNLKFNWLIRRIKFALKEAPHRFWRVLTFWQQPFYHRETPSVKCKAFVWLLVDLTFFFDFYEILTNLTRRNVRFLTEEEILRGQSIFSKSIDFQLVMLDNDSRLVKRGMAFAYVTFNTINFVRPMPADVFIHELVHVWQYQKFGAGYIANALAAQHTAAGYNYTFTEGWFESGSLLEFNAEQQADIVQDYFRQKHGVETQWAVSEDLSKFLMIINGEV